MYFIHTFDVYIGKCFFGSRNGKSYFGHSKRYVIKYFPHPLFFDSWVVGVFDFSIERFSIQ